MYLIYNYLHNKPYDTGSEALMLFIISHCLKKGNNLNLRNINKFEKQDFDIYFRFLMFLPN